MQVLQLLGSILLILAVFAVGRSLWRFVAGLFAARQLVEAHADAPDPAAVVTLIHGTFARKAPWTLPGSRLCQALGAHFADRVQLRRFEWSGRNSFRARRKAVADLIHDLAAARARWPGVPHYLVGHSHGGTVAIGGVLGSPEGAVDGVVCLATPVLTTRRRRFSRAVRTMIGLGFFVTLLLPWMDLESDAGPTDLEMGAMVVCAILAFVWYRAARRLAHTICDVQPYSELDPERTAFIRSPFDEASGIIGLANLLSWIVSRLTSGPFDVFASFERVDGGSSRLRMAFGYAVLAGAGLALLTLPDWMPAAKRLIEGTPSVGAVHTLATGLILIVGLSGFALTVLAPLIRLALRNKVVSWLIWPVYLYVMFLGAIFFVPAIVLMSLAHAAAVGIELLLCSVMVEVTAEPCPAGNWTVYQLRPPPEGGLRHSSVYESDAGLAALLRALEGIAAEGPVPLMNDQAEVPAATLSSAAA
uniref:serine aminopeptidase domain-containing protein n=1 Tax=Altererythrobacter segetis TaxID=1104773 RepID=UPI001409FF36|nr:alpha/beta hydrolase [Altererythrobacter segetis]